MKPFITCAAFLAFVFGMPSCSGSHDHEHSHHTEAEERDAHATHDHDHEAEEADSHEHEHAPGEIVMTPQDAARFGVGVEAVAAAPFADVVKTAGEVMPTGSDISVAAAPTAGRLRLAPGISVGTQVSAGQTIGQISASEVSGANENAVAKANLDAAERELKRVTTLLADGLVTRKEYNEALAARDAARAAYSPAAASGIVKAVKSGVISQLPAADGQIVAAGDVVATIGSTGRLTLRALLPASEASFLPSVKDAVITLADGRMCRLSEAGGKLMSNSAAGAASTPGYIPVYFSFDMTEGIPAGTPVEVRLLADKAGSVLSVPREAVAEQMGEKFVYVKNSEHSYIKTPVTLGRGDGLRYEVTSGLAEGDSVVIAGTTFVRLAETAGVVPEGHHHH